MLPKAVNFVKKYQNDIVLFIGVILAVLLAFAIGYIAAEQQEKKPPLQFEYEDQNDNS
ncbi:MAG: hypothetical protein AAB620_00515 [Patescibacteria group bacterium]